MLYDASPLIFDQNGLRVASVGLDGNGLFKTVTIARDLGRDIELESGISLDGRIVTAPPDGKFRRRSRPHCRHRQGPRCRQDKRQDAVLKSRFGRERRPEQKLSMHGESGDNSKSGLPDLSTAPFPRSRD